MPECRTKSEISSNAILRAIATNKKLSELPIELKEWKSARDDDVKKGLYIPATDTIYKFCTKQNKYIRNDPKFAFKTVRQWGVDVMQRSYPVQLSAKGRVYVDGQTLAWHESQGKAQSSALHDCN